ncbi:hypothetical protein [Corynebacterium glyciniphilum]|uniref:hypothetical protein n=1 Tax=Corynebacterium glyciniphilum TaxID=1404244 RepID=UPI00264C0705|nr:hypothetical protein [Corynebacterium glyciniphilum]MDN5684040.1 hypothetical protein [Corynebacterium glyciniphilum]
MSEGTGASRIGGVSARTHLALCLAQFKTEAASRWIPVGLLLIAHTVIVDDMSGTRQTVMAVLFGLVGAPTTSAFTMPSTQLRALGLGRRAQQMHVIASIVAGTVLYLVCIAIMWGVWRLRGVDDGPGYWLTGAIVVVMSVVSILVDLGKIRRGGVGGPRQLAGNDEWDRLAQRPGGHLLVMQHMARCGTVSTIVAFFLVMVPGQLIARVLFDIEPGTIGIVLTIVLVLTTVFSRVVHAERAAEVWTVYGGAPRTWQRAVMQNMWVLPVAYVAVYLVAWLVERGLDTIGWGREMPMLQPTGGGDWATVLAIVVSYGLMTVAMTTSVLSITVTKRFAGKRMVAPAVLVVNAALLVWLTSSFGAALHGWAVALCSLAVIVWTAVAVAAFHRSRSAVEVGQQTGVESYFGLSVRQ